MPRQHRVTLFLNDEELAVFKELRLPDDSMGKTIRICALSAAQYVLAQKRDYATILQERIDEDEYFREQERLKYGPKLA